MPRQRKRDPARRKALRAARKALRAAQAAQGTAPAPQAAPRARAGGRGAPTRQQGASMVVHLGRTLPQRPSYSGPLGRARYTVERFLSGCLPENAAMLRRVWADNDQLAARRVPQDALPAVMILAAYAHAQEIALVDDYEALCERLEDALQLEGAAPHPDLYFASSCVILNKRGTVPSTESFESIKVPEIYEELLG